MVSKVLTRFAPAFTRANAAFPAVAFFGGFIWDAATLGRSIQPFDLYSLLVYLLLAGGILIWMGRRGFMHGPAAHADVPHGSAEGSGEAPSASLAASGDPDHPS